MASPDEEPDAPAADRGRFVRRLGYLLAPGVVLALLATYLAAPEFYLSYVIHPKLREEQILENVTFVSALAAGLLLAFAALRDWNRGGHAGAVVMLCVAAAAVFFAGEEISWGQNFLGKNWKTPEEIAAFSRETNLHNSGLPIRELGNVFLAAVFFVLPAAWRIRARLQLPSSLGHAVAAGPVVFCMAFAFVWRLAKGAYVAGARRFSPQWTAAGDRFYVEFIEQLNEQKECLVALGLLVYGLYCVRSPRAPAAPGT